MGMEAQTVDELREQSALERKGEEKETKGGGGQGPERGKNPQLGPEKQAARR